MDHESPKGSHEQETLAPRERDMAPLFERLDVPVYGEVHYLPRRSPEPSAPPTGGASEGEIFPAQDLIGFLRVMNWIWTPFRLLGRLFSYLA